MLTKPLVESVDQNTQPIILEVTVVVIIIIVFVVVVV